MGGQAPGQQQQGWARGSSDGDKSCPRLPGAACAPGWPAPFTRVISPFLPPAPQQRAPVQVLAPLNG